MFSFVCLFMYHHTWVLISLKTRALEPAHAGVKICVRLRAYNRSARTKDVRGI